MRYPPTCSIHRQPVKSMSLVEIPWCHRVCLRMRKRSHWRFQPSGIPFKVSLNSYTRGAGNQWLQWSRKLFFACRTCCPAGLQRSVSDTTYLLVSMALHLLYKYIQMIKTPPWNDMYPDYWCPVPLIYLFGDTLRLDFQRLLHLPIQIPDGVSNDVWVSLLNIYLWTLFYTPELYCDM